MRSKMYCFFNHCCCKKKQSKCLYLNVRIRPGLCISWLFEEQYVHL